MTVKQPQISGEVTVTLAALNLGCSERHIRKLYAQGRISGRKVSARCILLDADSVERYTFARPGALRKSRKQTEGGR